MSPESYVRMIARRIALAAARKRREQLVGDAAPADLVSESIEGRIIARSTLRRLVVDLRALISPRDFRICAESFVRGGDGRTVAQRLRVSVQTVANVRHRARAVMESARVAI